MASLAGLKVGAYVRLSDDTEGDAEAVGRQERDTAQRVEADGGTVAQLYSENDTSAYKKRRVRRTDAQGQTFYVYRVIRPVYQQMLADLRQGVIDAAMVYDIDRLARDSRDLEDAIEVVEHYGRLIVGVSGSIDLTTSDGRTMARVMVAMANKSSADTARRVKRKHQENAEEGIPVGGTCPFGWSGDKTDRATYKRALDPVESALIQEAARRVLTGAPVSAVVTDWNDRGVRTSRGNAWTPKALKGVLTNPRVCGYSARNVTGPDGKEVLTVVRKNGQPVIGVWETILSVGDWEALCLALTPKNRRPGGNAHRYLLSALLACGKCGQPMRGIARGRHRNAQGKPAWRTFAYQCQSKSLGGCGGVSVGGPDTDEFVTEALFLRYERSKPQAAPVPLWYGEQALARVRSNIAAATTAWKAGDLDSADYFALRRELSDDEKALTTARAAVVAERASVAAAPDDLRTVWDVYSLAEQRAALSALLVAVVVQPLPAMVPALDSTGAPVLGRTGKAKRSRPRAADGQVAGTDLTDRIGDDGFVWRQPTG